MCLLNVNELMYLRQRSLHFDKFTLFLHEHDIRIATHLISLEFEMKYQKFSSDEYRLANPNLVSLLPRLHQFILSAHHSIHFYTMDCNARHAVMYSIRQGTTAVEAAALIHQNIRIGFIAADVLSFEDLLQHGDWEAAKLFGKVRQVGKHFVLSDGEIVQFVYRAPTPASEMANLNFNKDSCPVLRS